MSEIDQDERLFDENLVRCLINELRSLKKTHNELLQDIEKRKKLKQEKRRLISLGIAHAVKFSLTEHPGFF